MVKFKEVDPTDIPNIRDSRRGRVSYPILKSFLETGMVAAQLDRTGMQQSLQSLNSSLTNYIKSHSLPIKIINRRGEIYLIRTDLDDYGNPIPDVEVKLETEKEIKFVTDDEVAMRFQEEKDQTTK
jgi:hypothetical protein